MNDIAASPSFCGAVQAYLSHWRALGRRYRQEEWLLNTLLRDLPAIGYRDLTREAFLQWFDARKDRHPNSRRKWAQLIRHFCLFRRRSEPACFAPGDELVCRRQPYVTPVIVSMEHACAMLRHADTLEPSPNSPLRAAAMRLAVVLLYTTGMRLGELLRLSLYDVKDDAAVLHIRDSKFHKSRLLPLSEGTRRELQGYLERRRAFGFDARPTAALLCTRAHGKIKPYSAPGMQRGINELFAATRVTDAAGRRPRVHDLRHSFALQVLARGYRQGADVQCQLPMLAMYMGHVSIESTAYYLRWTDELAALASDRFARCFGSVLGTQS
jgi:integrase/recombinase XerD